MARRAGSANGKAIAHHRRVLGVHLNDRITENRDAWSITSVSEFDFSNGRAGWRAISDRQVASPNAQNNHRERWC